MCSKLCTKRDLKCLFVQFEIPDPLLVSKSQVTTSRDWETYQLEAI